MVATATLQLDAAIDYGFLLLAHVICADQQIHHQESIALRNLAEDAKINKVTLQEMEKILGQDDAQISLKEAAQNVPVGQRSEVLKQVLAIAYIDGYFSPLEREAISQIARLWGIGGPALKQILEKAQGFGRQRPEVDEKADGLSVGARLLKGAESVLSRSLVTRLAELAPERIGQRIEQLQREILLSGPEYDDAIQCCAKIAGEDFNHSKRELERTYQSLQNLGNGIQQVIHAIDQKTDGQGQYQTAKGVAEQLEQTRQNLADEILHDIEIVQEALRAKQRALNHFSIAFMGRTKAGKSTLHAVITGEGWEAIGVGKQRTTRYNRVYEWKNIRIIDTPGIGAPGGKTDEEIAHSVIEEADVICYLVTDDSIQESEFAFLKVLKEKTKPLIILLNIQCNLRDSRRLEYFLKNPNRWFALEGKNSIGGHLNRIRRYAQNHYPNDYLDVLPVMLLAAQLSREPEHQKQSRQLFQASHLQDFLDSIRISLIEYGTIRRSQTLLGSTVGSIITPHKWISQQAIAYKDLAVQLRVKQQVLQKQIQAAQQDSWERLQQKLKEIFQNAHELVTSFAEDNWDASEDTMKDRWKRKLKSIEFEQSLNTAFEEALQGFQHDVQEAIEEIGKELQLINQLQGGSFDFKEQDAGFVNRDFLRRCGMVLVAAGAILAFVFPPLGLLGVVGGVVSWVANRFKSHEQKRHEAVKNISSSLKSQLADHQEKVLQQAGENFEQHCQSIVEAIENYFEELTQGIEAIATELKTAEGKLLTAANYLNRAYAKRIIDWAAGQYEPLTDAAVNEKICKVNRVFGRSFQIQTKTALPLTKSQAQICKVLQERVSIQSIKR